ncbi:MAG: response regulator [Candidatus Heimdallarchaeota archaeon]|nr:response regulator [Candidatus Heimdallarchaeota archaeon]
MRQGGLPINESPLDLNNWSKISPIKSTPDSLSVLVITSSPEQQTTLHSYLKGLGYEILGPFRSVSMGLEFISHRHPDLIIFDLVSNREERDSFTNLMENEAQSIPMIVLTNSEIKLSELEENSIELPVDPVQLSYKMEKLFDYQNQKISPVVQLIDFSTSFINKIHRMSPIDTKPRIKSIINRSFREDEIASFVSLSIPDGEFDLTVIEEDLPLETISSTLIFILRLIMDRMSSELEVGWTESLIAESIQSLAIEAHNFTKTVNQFVGKMGINTIELANSLTRLMQEVEEIEKSVFVGYMTLSDMGPVMLEVIGNDDQISTGIDDRIASQIITLVGQGSSYHEGIFGPIPIPTANNICGVIWSKVLQSKIKDIRMVGKSLSVIVIGFYSELLSIVPTQNELKEIFGFLESANHVNDITSSMLGQIQQDFLSKI